MRHVVIRLVLESFALFAALACLAQTPAFDVASIRLTDGAAQQHVQTSPRSLTIRGGSIGFLIQWAYDVPYLRVSGPAWIRDSHFDLDARTAETADDAQLRLMLRTLLADRFGVKVHSEQRQMQAYAMTLARGGPKFSEATTEGPPVIDRTSPVILRAHRVTMNDIAEQISLELGLPVVDASGLKGRYEIYMDVTPYVAGAGTPDAGKPDMMGILFNGLQEQLGLRLESRKASVSILVVDHAEKVPTEN